MNTRTPEQHHELQEFWLSQVRKSSRIAHILRILFCVTGGLILLGGIRFVLEDGTFLFVALALLLYVPIIIYIWKQVSRLTSMLKRGRFRNITLNQPAALAQCTGSLAGQMGIPVDSLEIWLNNKSHFASPSVCAWRGKKHLILPLGFFKILSGDPGMAYAIIAHEFSHIRQRDADLLVTIKAVIRSIIVVMVPMTALVVIGIVMTNMQDNQRSLMDEMDSRMQAIEYATQGDNTLSRQLARGYFDQADLTDQTISENEKQNIFAVVQLVLLIVGYQVLRRVINHSEYTADLGAAIFCSSPQVRAALGAYEVEKKRPLIVRLFSLNPSRQKRLSAIDSTTKRFPFTQLSPPFDKQSISILQDKLSLFQWGLIFFLLIAVPCWAAYRIYFTYTILSSVDLPISKVIYGWMALLIVSAVMSIKASLSIIDGSAKKIRKLVWYLIVIFIVFSYQLWEAHSHDYSIREIAVTKVIEDNFTFALLNAILLIWVFYRLCYKNKDIAEKKTKILFNERAWYYPQTTLIKQWAVYPTAILLLLVSPVCFVLDYSVRANRVVFSDPLWRFFSAMAKENVWDISLFSARLIFVGFAFYTGIKLWQGSRNIIKLLVISFCLFAVILIIDSYLLLYNSSAFFNYNWYFTKAFLHNRYYVNAGLLLTSIRIILASGAIIVISIGAARFRFKKVVATIAASLIVIVAIFPAISGNRSVAANLVSKLQLKNKSNCNMVGILGTDTVVCISQFDSTQNFLQVWDINKKMPIWEYSLPTDGNRYNTLLAANKTFAISNSDSIIFFHLDEGPDFALQAKIPQYGAFDTNKDWTIFASDFYTDTSRLVENVLVNNHMDPSKNIVINKEAQVIKMSPDGRFIAVFSKEPPDSSEYYNDMFIFNIASHEAIVSLQVPADYSSASQFTSDSKRFAFISDKNKLNVIDLTPVQLITQINLSDVGQQDGSDIIFRFTHNGRYLASWGDNYMPISIWDTKKGAFVKNIGSGTKKAAQLYFSDNDQFIYSGDSTGTIEKLRTGLAF